VYLDIKHGTDAVRWMPWPQVHVTEREKQKLKVWAQMMPYREPFAWAAVPLFDNSIPGVAGGFGSPSSPLPAGLGSSGIDPGLDMVGRTLSEGRVTHDSSGTPVIVEIPGLNRVKENYVEESLQVINIFQRNI
jgi:hypothetical protein